MTFKTKFKIGQEVLHEGAMHTIDFVYIHVGRSFREIAYFLSDIHDFNVSEAVLLKDNPQVR
jgi:hypothetical protein